MEIDLQNHGKFQNKFTKFQTAKDVENTKTSVVKPKRKKVKSKLSSYQNRLKNKRFVMAVMKKDPQRNAEMFNCNRWVKKEPKAKRRNTSPAENGNILNDFMLDENSDNLFPRTLVQAPSCVKCHGIEKVNACMQVNIHELTLKKVCNVSIQCKIQDYNRKLGGSTVRVVNGNTSVRPIAGGKTNTDHNDSTQDTAPSNTD